MKLEKKILKFFILIDFYKWDPQEMFLLCLRKLRFKPINERTEGTYSKYNSIDGNYNLHYYTTYIKFGVGRASWIKPKR